MEYTVPPKPKDPKQKMIRVTETDEIDAIKRADLKSPIGGEYVGQWFAEEHSLKQYRRLEVEFNV